MADGNKKDPTAQLSDHERGRAVSIGTFVDERPTIEEIRLFTPSGERDSLLIADLGSYGRNALETIAGRKAARCPPFHVALWALERGQARLWNLNNVRAVCDARDTLLATGSEHIGQLEDWKYKPHARDGAKRFTVRHVKQTERNRVLALASGLGLSQGTTAALGIIFGLVDAPKLSEELADLLQSEVRAFADAVQRRALIASDLAKRAAQSPAKMRQNRYSEVIGED